MRKVALVVGINHYNHLGILNAPVNNARSIAQILSQSESEEGFDIFYLPEYYDNWEEAFRIAETQNVPVTTNKLKDALVKLFDPGVEGDIPDTALFYFSGHGLLETPSWPGKPLKGFLATTDSSQESSQSQPRESFSLQELHEILGASRIQQQIVWLDCCHSGTLMSFGSTSSTGYARDRCFIASCRATDESLQSADGYHTTLTRLLVQGLKTLRQQHDTVNNLRLVTFISDNWKGRQYPVFSNTGYAIPLIRGMQSSVSSANDSPLSHDLRCSNDPPYRGLRVFEFNDEDPKYFYGRTFLTDELLKKIHHSNFLAVLGASGSGKSSLVQAGLLHQLKLGQRLSGSHQWKMLPIIRPGENPLRALASAFIEPDAPPKRKWRDRQRYEQLFQVQGANALEELVSDYEDAPYVVLVIDQFEEIFTHCTNDDTREEFLNCVLGALKPVSKERTEPGPKLKVIMTMRADFLGRAVEYEVLAPLIQNHLVTVTPMAEFERQDAIEKPAQQVGLTFEDGLVKAILDEVGVVSKSQGYLPLMQFALEKLWEQRDQDQHRLTQLAYKTMGGVKGALNQHANHIFDYTRDENGTEVKRSEQQQNWIRRIFLRLIRTSESMEDTRQVQRRTELLAMARDNQDDHQTVENLIRELVQARLLVASAPSSPEEQTASSAQQSEGIVELAHEVLLDSWSLLREWREESRKILRLRDRLEEFFIVWKLNGYKNEDLLMGGVLTRMQANWLVLKSHLNGTQIDFFNSSDRYDKKQISSRRDLEKKLHELQEMFERIRQNENASNKQLNIELERQRSEYAAIFQRFNNRMENCQIAADWLIENRNMLARIPEIMSNPVLMSEITSANIENTIQCFQEDIDDYLDWLKASLEGGRIIPLEKTDLKTLEIPKPKAYTVAFKAVRTAIEKSGLPVGVIMELQGMISYLINYFSSSASGKDAD